MRKRAISKREARINAFYKFLIENDAFVEYRKNVRDYKGTNLTIVFSNEINSWISLAFSWLSTKEGWDYWMDMSIRWDEYVTKNEIK